ncbi:hypothetical protein lbkm_3851 [Lachnospiraceae bacterium KM106-2]|nr:hypothetical protein lbkm_3851 [Lachnospiraceae bacterium KM106-2]
MTKSIRFLLCLFLLCVIFIFPNLNTTSAKVHSNTPSKKTKYFYVKLPKHWSIHKNKDSKHYPDNYELYYFSKHVGTIQVDDQFDLYKTAELPVITDRYVGNHSIRKKVYKAINKKNYTVQKILMGFETLVSAPKSAKPPKDSTYYFYRSKRKQLIIVLSFKDEQIKASSMNYIYQHLKIFC